VRNSFAHSALRFTHHAPRSTRSCTLRPALLACGRARWFPPIWRAACRAPPKLVPANPV